MALYEDWAPLARPRLVLERRTTLAAVLGRSVEWLNEAPGLVRGLAELAWPLRWNFAIVFGFNVVIAVWETIQPFILAWGVDSFEARVPYLQIVAIIVLPVVAIGLPHGIALPFARDLYAAWFVKPRYERLVGLLCFERGRSATRATTAELDGKKAPIAQEGRLVAYQLTEMLLRDPAFAIRGVVVLTILLFKSPILVGVLLIGMVADLFVTMLMDARLFMPYAVLREHQFRLRGLEYQLLDAHPRDHASSAEREARSSDYEHEWDAYVRAAQFVESRRLIYQLPVREGISTIIRVAVMLLVGWWVHVGDISIGDYILFTSLAGRANDPLWVFLGVQQQIMTTRESLRRLGLLCGVNFGIERPLLREGNRIWGPQASNAISPQRESAVRELQD
jgi:ABC-type bacteriocin/lantibiotic exporter with double-glycine peptidase domain